jgi:hypothetical protein
MIRQRGDFAFPLMYFAHAAHTRRSSQKRILLWARRSPQAQQGTTASVRHTRRWFQCVARAAVQRRVSAPDSFCACAYKNTVFASQVIEESQLQFGYGSALHQPGDDPPAGDGCVTCSCRVSLHA